MGLPVEPLIETLRQLATVVGGLTPDQYTWTSEAFAGSSIGAHVRHCLDHADAFLEAADTGSIEYDQRERGTPVETDPEAALERIRRMETRLCSLPATLVDRPLTVRAILSAGGAPVVLPSSVLRELAYVVSHTTHHNAILGFLVRAVGGATPFKFGYAASTLAYMAQLQCAR